MNTNTTFNWANRAHLFDRLRWNWPQDDERTSRVQGKIALVGLPGVGKKTLCNTLWGWEAIEQGAESIRNFGLFTLIDLPVDPADTASVLYKLEAVDLVIYMLDATQPLSPTDFTWISRLRTLDATLVVAANRINLLPEEAAKQILTTLQDRVARPVLPVNAMQSLSVQGYFIPALLRWCPEVSYALAGEVKSLRRRVLLYLIVRSALTGLLAHMQTGGVDDTPVLMQVQMQMVKRIAALHGQPETAVKRIEFVLNTLLRLQTNNALRLTKRFSTRGLWIISSALAVASTILVAAISVLYYGVILQPKEQPNHAAQRSAR